MTGTQRSQLKQEFAQHWTLILAASVGFSFTAVMTASTGLFMVPLSEEFGWSRTLLSSGVAITSILTFFGSPLFGWLIDRWGTRRLALPGLFLLMCTFAALSTLTGSHIQWFAIWVVYAIAALMTKSTVWTAAVNSVFTTGRGLALGLTLTGSAVAQIIAPPLADYLIATQGWRAAYVWLALSWGSLALVLCVVWLRDAYYAKAKERLANPQAARTDKTLLDVPGLSIPQAWRSPDLWRIAISAFVIMTVTIAVMIHQVPILVDLGVDRTTAAYYASFGGMAGIIGKLVTGTLLDRYAARWAGGGTIAFGAITFALLLLPHRTPELVLIAMVVNGYTAGAKLQIIGFLVAAYGGMRNFGAILGTVSSLVAAGSGLGPIIAGQIYDRIETYDPFLWFGLAGTLFSAALLFGLKAYPEWKKAEAAE